MLLIFILFLSVQVNSSGNLRQLISDYDKVESPFYTNHKTVLVNVSVPFIALGIALTEETQATLVYKLTLNWVDVRLRFDPIDYGNLTALYLPESEIWTPRYSVYNAMNTRAISKGRDSDVRIESDGRVEQSGYFFSKVLCFDHIQNFPFDKTSCGLVMSSSINMSVMRLTVVRAAFTTVRGNEEFTPTNYSAMYSLPNDPAMDNEIQLLITFQRNPVYFIIVVVIPATLVTILTVTGVLLPVSPNGDFDPVNIGLTSLLALSITLTVVADNLPRTIKVPLLGWFVLSCLAICVIAIFFGITFAKFKQLAKKPEIDLKAISTVFKGDQVVEIKRGRKRAIVRAIIKWFSIALFIFLQSALICNLLIFFSHTWREEKIDPFENYNQTDWEKFSVNFWNEHFSTYINCTFYSQNL